MKIKFSKDKNKRMIAIMAGIVTVLLVSTIFIQFKSVDSYKKSDIEGLREEDLKTQIAAYKTKISAISYDRFRFYLFHN